MKRGQQVEEGTWIAVPSGEGGYFAGLVARSEPGGSALFVYMFGPPFAELPGLADVRGFKAEEADQTFICGDLGIIQGTWRIIGREDGWKRQEWPMLDHASFSGRWFRIVYDDRNPALVIDRIEDDSAKTLPRDWVAGSLVVEASMTSRYRSRFRLVEEGTWFSFPALDGRRLVGLITRTSETGELCYAYVFDHDWLASPSLEILQDLKPESAIYQNRVNDYGFLCGEWQVVGKQVPWKRAQWPMRLSHRSKLNISATSYSVEYFAVRYDENDISKVVSDDEPIPSRDGYLSEGFCPWSALPRSVENSLKEHARARAREAQKIARAAVKSKQSGTSRN